MEMQIALHWPQDMRRKRQRSFMSSEKWVRTMTWNMSVSEPYPKPATSPALKPPENPHTKFY